MEWHLEYSKLSHNDKVLEIGAGIGTLTLFLIQKVRKVVAVEIDERLVNVLKDRLSTYDNVEIVQSDILKLDDSFFEEKKVISNPPYKISSPLLFKLFKTKYKMALLTLQKEFAERLVAIPNSKSYGKISVNSSFYSNIEMLKIIPKNFFFPIPKVDSALVRITPKDVESKIINLDFYNELLNALFSQKNKILEKVLKKFLENQIEKDKIQEIFSKITYSRRRIRELDLKTIVDLSNLIFQKKVKEQK